MNILKENTGNILEEVDIKVKEFIDINKIDNVEDFDFGLYLTNIFEPIFKRYFKNSDDNTQKIARAVLWTKINTYEKVKQYENYITENNL